MPFAAILGGMPRAFAALAALTLALASPAFCADAPSRGDYLTVSVVVIGPGDELFAWWGHVGVVVRDDLRGEETLYDYGIFSFEEEHFLRNFITGNFLYSMMARDAARDIDWYIRDNRDITSYTLNLDARQKERVLDFLEWNALPQNRRYYYKLFTDNCVTRVAFLLDGVLDGRFVERFGGAPGRLSVREHSNRHMYFSPAVYWLLNFIMGPALDGPPRAFAEMFLPSEFGANIAAFSYRDGSGAEVPLVSAVETVNVSKGRRLPLAEPPAALVPALAGGLSAALACGLCRFWYRATRRRAAQACLGLLQSAFGLVLGALGTLLFYLTFFSQHIYTFHNINVLFANPLPLLAVPAGAVFARARNPRTAAFCRTALRAIWAYVAAAALLGLALKLSPRFFQDNSLTLALVLPPALVLGMPGRALSFLKRALLRLCAARAA